MPRRGAPDRGVKPLLPSHTQLPFAMKPPTELDAVAAAPAEAAIDNPVVGIDQTAGNFSYDVN